MSATDLRKPLISKRVRRAARRVRVSPIEAAAGMLAVFLLIVFAWLIFAHDPNGGQPRVVARIQRGDPITTGSVTQGLTKAPRPTLLEAGKYGPVPRIFRGDTPLAVYSRPAPPQLAASPLPKVALIIAGIGLDQRASAEAIERLPADVTLGLAPEGDGLQTWVDRARASGHEVLLQLSPRSVLRNPGQALMAEPAGAELHDDLSWHLARAVGYFGLITMSPARLDDDQFRQTVFKELQRRGLGLILGSRAEWTQGAEATHRQQPNFAAADMVLDADSDSEAIEAALHRLAIIASEKGFAMGTAAASPVTIEVVRRWANQIASDGQILLVPASIALRSQDQ